jgi:hypothetical protein
MQDHARRDHLLDRFRARHSADKLRDGFQAEMFIARSANYSVSHFIDCRAIARRLCASLIASGNTADEMERSRT